MEAALDRVGSEVFSKEYFSQKKPAIITDVIPKWQAHGAWSPEYLAQRFRDKPVEVAISRTFSFKYNADGSNLQENRRMPFAELISRITASQPAEEHYYLIQKSVPDEFPELLKEFQTPAWINTNTPLINLWVGAAENRTPLHYDLSNNFFAQMYGSKHFTIYDPFQTPHLYPSPLGQKWSHLSRVDVEAPDLVAFPEFAKSKPVRFTIGPGELLFLPAYWWHQVRSLSTSISLNFWWPPEFQQHFTPNGVRQLWGDYEKDRLQNVRQALLAPNGLNWFDAAELVKPVERMASVLFIGAAIEEFVRDLHAKGRNSNGVPFDLRAACLQLESAGKLSEGTRSKILAWEALVSKARQGENLSDAEVSMLTAEVRHFLITGITSTRFSKWKTKLVNNRVTRRVHRLVSRIAPRLATKVRRRFVYDDLEFYDKLLQLDHPSFIWMNYGLDGDDFSWLREPEDHPWKYQINLARHNLGSVELKGKSVLDTGSGRGGNCWYIKRYHDPARIVGLDQCQGQIDWCKRRFQGTGIEFVCGDAQDLPFENGSFDVVTNIESAGHYPSLQLFVRGVQRVLRPAGYFCHSCCYHNPSETQRIMEAAGLTCVMRADITQSVRQALKNNDENLRRYLDSVAGTPEARQVAAHLHNTLTMHIPLLLATELQYHSWIFQKPARI